MRLDKAPFYLTEDDMTWVMDTLSQMSEEEKIGQLFCPIGGMTDEYQIKEFLDKYQPGGMMFRAMPAEGIRNAHETLQRYSKLPLLLAANLEAGGNGMVQGGTCIGKQMQVAATDEEEQAYRLGKTAAREASAVGCNWSFGPIVDIDYNYHNPITNVRTFGSDPDRVLRMGRAYAQAMKEEGMAVAAKHFPGDGVDERDQHLLVSENTLSVEEWEASYGKVYRGMIESGVLSIMAGHIRMPAYQMMINPKLGREQCMPATLSPELLKGLLRNRLGFEGLIITDATPMMGFNVSMPRKKAIPTAIAAGCDMILFNKSIEEDYESMRQGIRDGILTWERVDEAVTRILAMKAALKLHRNRLPHGDLSLIGCEEHKNWAKECAEKAVTLVKDTQHLLPLDVKKYPRVRMHILGDCESFMESNKVGDQMKELFEKEGFSVTCVNGNTMDAGEIFGGGVDCVRKSFDLAVYIANVETGSNQTTTRINWRTMMAADAPWYMQDIPTLFISTANPYHLLDVPYIKTYINGYSGHQEVLHAIMEKIMGRSEFVGKAPSDPFCQRYDTRF